MSYQKFITNLGISQPTSKPLTPKGTGFTYAPNIVPTGEATPGQKLLEDIKARQGTGLDIYRKGRQQDTNRVATDVTGKSAMDIPTDEFGQVSQTLTDFRQPYTNQIKSITQRGNLATQAEEAKNVWRQAKQVQDLGQYSFSGNITTMGTGNGANIPGASDDNPGAKAVDLAMKAFNNKTPYVWGGNSLTKGVDCSGLVQQVYRQLGVTLPRTTYEQAKTGRQINVNEARPGDLIFYNLPGDKLGHIGLYMGNGKIVHAANSRIGIVVGNLHGSNGPPVLAIRPY